MLNLERFLKDFERKTEHFQELRYDGFVFQGVDDFVLKLDSLVCKRYINYFSKVDVYERSTISIVLTAGINSDCRRNLKNDSLEGHFSRHSNFIVSFHANSSLNCRRVSHVSQSDCKEKTTIQVSEIFYLQDDRHSSYEEIPKGGRTKEITWSDCRDGYCYYTYPFY